MKKIKLTNRLQTIAELAGRSKSVADVGTDHAYIPIWLLSSGMAEQVIASDVKAQPLEHAKRSAKEYGIETGIDFALSDGMTHLNADSAETVIIAGMGGETIADILSRSEWISDGTHSFVLQPMTKSAELLSRIYEMGLYIENARLAEDGDDIYLVLLAKAGAGIAPTHAGLVVPYKLIENNDPLAAKYIDININRTKSAIEGIRISNSVQSNKRLNELENLFNELIAMRGEL